MMNELLQVPDWRIPTAGITVVGPHAIKLVGTITLRDPSRDLTPHLRRLHEAAMSSGVGRVDVDVTDLEFVNSSAIRCLVDWVTWVALSAGQPGAYQLCFHTRPATTWQRTSFRPLKALAPGVVEVMS